MSDLLDWSPPSALARNSDPDTSHAAAAGDLSGLEAEVYRVIQSYGERGCIFDDVLARYPDNSQSISPRFRRLMDKRLVVDTGERRTAKSGRKQRVMRAVEVL